MKFIHKLALVVLGVIFTVLAIMFVLSVVLGDDTTLDTGHPNGTNGMPPISQQ